MTIKICIETINAYIKLVLNSSEVFKSTTKFNTSNPVWNESVNLILNSIKDDDNTPRNGQNILKKIPEFFQKQQKKFFVSNNSLSINEKSTNSLSVEKNLEKIKETKFKLILYIFNNINEIKSHGFGKDSLIGYVPIDLTSLNENEYIYL